MNAQKTQNTMETVQTDPQANVTLPEIVWLPRGDYAQGMRTQPRNNLEWPDYARGLRTLPREIEGSDYARGLRTLPRPIQGPDFARGLRQN